LAGGQAGYEQFLSALGVNGADKQAAVSGAYLNSPIEQQIRNLTMQGINRAYAPTGQGGAATAATSNALLQDWNNYVSRLGGVASQGANTANLWGTTGMQYGSDLANTNFATNQLLANNKMALGNAQANATMAGSALNNSAFSNLIKMFSPTGQGGGGGGGGGGGFGSSPMGSMFGGMNQLFQGGSDALSSLGEGLMSFFAA
jgi:hypothetical protein